MLRNFEKFEVGHYYVCTNMIPQILKCMHLSKEDEIVFVSLKGLMYNLSNITKNFDNCVEVENPDAIFERGDCVLEHNQHYKYWKKVVIGSCFLTEHKQDNGYDNGSFVHYICKRKPKEKDDIMSMSFDYMNERLKCPHCGRGKDIRIHYVIYLESTGKNYKDKCFHCGKQYRYDKASQQLKLISDEHIEGVKALSKMLGEDNPFKKYIRQKKYLTFGKKKKHTK